MSSAFLRSLQSVLLFTGLLLTSGWLQADESSHHDSNGSYYSVYLALDLADEHDSEESAALSQFSFFPNSDGAKPVAIAIITLHAKPTHQCIRAPPVNA